MLNVRLWHVNKFVWLVAMKTDLSFHLVTLKPRLIYLRFVTWCMWSPQRGSTSWLNACSWSFKWSKQAPQHKLIKSKPMKAFENYIQNILHASVLNVEFQPGAKWAWLLRWTWQKQELSERGQFLVFMSKLLFILVCLFVV